MILKLEPKGEKFNGARAVPEEFPT